MELSITKRAESGVIAAYTFYISSNKAVSCLCLPDVSTMMISNFYSLKKATPS